MDVSLRVEAESAAAATKLSSASAVIKLKCAGVFEVRNIGQPFLVDGRLLSFGDKVRLAHQSVLTFGDAATFHFLINRGAAALIARKIAAHASKRGVARASRRKK